MAKIKVSGVGFDGTNYRAVITVVEEAVIEGEPAERPLGEATIMFPQETKKKDIENRVMAAARGIMDAHRAASSCRSELEKMTFPEVN